MSDHPFIIMPKRGERPRSYKKRSFWDILCNKLCDIIYRNRIFKDNEILNGKHVWFISDMHFGHPHIIEWCRSDVFQNLYMMHKRIIENWNYKVKRCDRVYCLGDFGDFKYKQELKGKIILAKGNHDRKQWNRQYVLKYRDMKFLVLHDPDNATGWFNDGWIIHGHTHVNSPFVDIEKKRINVSVEAINYSPLSMEEIYQIVKESANFKDHRWFL